MRDVHALRNVPGSVALACSFKVDRRNGKIPRRAEETLDILISSLFHFSPLRYERGTSVDELIERLKILGEPSRLACLALSVCGSV